MSTDLRTRVRQRRYRERKRDGRRVFLVEIEPEVVDAMIERGWLSRAGAEDRGQVREAIEDLFDSWARGTLTCEPMTTTRNAKTSCGSGYRLTNLAVRGR